jgi:hypothetical protein
MRGFKRVLKDLRAMMKAMQGLEKLGSKYKKNKGLNKFVKSIETKAAARIND